MSLWRRAMVGVFLLALALPGPAPAISIRDRLSSLADSSLHPSSLSLQPSAVPSVSSFEFPVSGRQPFGFSGTFRREAPTEWELVAYFREIEGECGEAAWEARSLQEARMMALGGLREGYHEVLSAMFQVQMAGATGGGASGMRALAARYLRIEAENLGYEAAVRLLTRTGLSETQANRFLLAMDVVRGARGRGRSGPRPTLGSNASPNTSSLTHQRPRVAPPQGGNAANTRVGYHATYPEAAQGIRQTGFRPGTQPGRLGSGGTYVNNTPEGAISEFTHHNPGVTPEVLRVRYNPGVEAVTDVAPVNYVERLPLNVDSITAPSIRLPGTQNTIIYNVPEVLP